MANQRETVQKPQKWVNNILVNDIAFEKERNAEGKFVRYDENGNDVTGQKNEQGKEIGKTKIRTFSYEVDVTRKGEDGKEVTTREAVADRVTVTLFNGDRNNHNDGRITAAIPAKLIKDYGMVQQDLANATQAFNDPQGKSEEEKAEAKRAAETKIRIAKKQLDVLDKDKAYRKSNALPPRKAWLVSLPEGKPIPVQVVKAIEGDDKHVKIVYGNTNAQNFKKAMSEKAYVNSFSYTPNGNEKIVELKGRAKEAEQEAAPELEQVATRKKSKSKANTQGM